MSLMNWFGNILNSKVHGANMGPIWGRRDPGGPHVDPMNFAIWDVFEDYTLRITTTSLRSQWVKDLKVIDGSLTKKDL